MSRYFTKNKKRLNTRAAQLMVLAGAAALLWVSTPWLGKTAADEGARILEESVRRASVQCYALEGRYPPTLAHLQASYGVGFDTARYRVFYTPHGSNLMPDITVIQRSASHLMGD